MSGSPTVILGSETGSPTIVLGSEAVSTSRRAHAVTATADHDSASAEAVAALRSSPPHSAVSSSGAAAEFIEATSVTPNGNGGSALRVSASDTMPESSSQVFLLDDMA